MEIWLLTNHNASSCDRSTKILWFSSFGWYYVHCTINEIFGHLAEFGPRGASCSSCPSIDLLLFFSIAGMLGPRRMWSFQVQYDLISIYWIDSSCWFEIIPYLQEVLSNFFFKLCHKVLKSAYMLFIVKMYFYMVDYLWIRYIFESKCTVYIYNSLILNNFF